MQPKSQAGEYALATGQAAALRLHLLHRCYSPVGRRVLLEAGLKPGMAVADFGCGVGATTAMLAEMVGPTGRVVGVDLSGAQLEQGRAHCRAQGIENATFVEASAYSTGLPRASFDLAYCRFLLLHLTDPAAALREMRDVLKPGGILVVEDGNLLSASSVPPSALRVFADLWDKLAPTRGVNYALADNLFHLVKSAGFGELKITIHQPAFAEGDEKQLLKMSVEEIGPACIASGLITEEELKASIAEMDRATKDPEILALAPRMSLVSGRKPA